MSLRSGEVADAAGINPQTLRYYERRGILAEPERSLGGHRLYPPETVTLLRTIKAAQRLGFTLDEVADLLAATNPPSRRNHRSVAGGLADRARGKLIEVEQKILDLEAIRDTLRATIDAGCSDLVACATEDCCPIVFTDIDQDGADTWQPTMLTLQDHTASCCQKD